MSTRRLLVWHQKSEDNECAPPIAVHAWLEQGSQLPSALIQPKFCWMEIQDEDAQDKSILNKPL